MHPQVEEAIERLGQAIRRQHLLMCQQRQELHERELKLMKAHEAKRAKLNHKLELRSKEISKKMEKLAQNQENTTLKEEYLLQKLRQQAEARRTDIRENPHAEMTEHDMRERRKAKTSYLKRKTSTICDKHIPSAKKKHPGRHRLSINRSRSRGKALRRRMMYRSRSRRR
eukprot:GEMP01054827.1.p1 GENE.GEMP01054827.1~~GEMP01054827.1.p1  ORF type:complete len:170 (+),score=40.78 GEMP01054827.1:177-686(+)